MPKEATSHDPKPATRKAMPDICRAKEDAFECPKCRRQFLSWRGVIRHQDQVPFCDEWVCPAAGQGSIYIVWRGDHKEQEKNVYKVGRTHKSIEERMEGYIKGSVALFVRHVDARKLVLTELHILRALRKHPHVKERRDIGLEYFQGELGDIKRIIQEHTGDDTLLPEDMMWVDG